MGVFFAFFAKAGKSSDAGGKSGNTKGSRSSSKGRSSRRTSRRSPSEKSTERRLTSSESVVTVGEEVTVTVQGAAAQEEILISEVQAEREFQSPSDDECEQLLVSGVRN